MCPRLVLQPDKDLLRDADGVPRPFCALLQGLSVIWQRQYGAYSFQGSHQKPANRQKMIFLHWVTCYGEINIEVKNQSIDGNNLLAHCTISSFYNQRSWLLSWGRWVRILQTVKSTTWLTRWNFLHFIKMNLSTRFYLAFKSFFGQVDVDGSGLIEFHEFVKFIVRNYFLFSTKS